MARILSLDDDLCILQVLRLILEFSGYESLQASDEQEALSILRTQAIDLFTQDFVRPGLGGCKFLQKIKSEERLQSVPVLGISAWRRNPQAKYLRQFGLDIDRDLDGYLTKPFTPIQLLDEVEAILKRYSKALPPEKVRRRARRQLEK